jgi:hypothetical protein
MPCYQAGRPPVARPNECVGCGAPHEWNRRSCSYCRRDYIGGRQITGVLVDELPRLAEAVRLGLMTANEARARAGYPSAPGDDLVEVTRLSDPGAVYVSARPISDAQVAQVRKDWEKRHQSAPGKPTFWPGPR